MPINARRSAAMASSLGKGEVESSILSCSTTNPRVFRYLPRSNYAWARTLAPCMSANLRQCLFTRGSMKPEIAATTLVYFISANETRHPIKIGKTTGRALAARLTSLQVGTPKRLFIMHLAEAPPETEKLLHREFGRYRVRGEWFEWARPLVDHIEALEIASGGRWRRKYGVESWAFSPSVFGHTDGPRRRNLNRMFGLGRSAQAITGETKCLTRS
jgi:hypothetical protein